MEDAAYLRQRSRQCIRLAGSINDSFAIERLTLLAKEYEARAVAEDERIAAQAGGEGV